MKLRSGDYSFKYLLSRPGTVQMRGLYIQILVSMPPYSQKHLNYTNRHILNPHKTNHAQRNPTKHCRITLRVILFLSNELSIQKSEYHNLSTSPLLLRKFLTRIRFSFFNYTDTGSAGKKRKLAVISSNQQDFG